jgi:hypothetical protein
MANLEFFRQALIAALPEATKLERGKGPERAAARAAEFARAACVAAGIEPPVDPEHAKKPKRGRPPKDRPKHENMA